jgi:hypothetical protein
MAFVPVNENSNQWRALYVSMAKGEAANISDKHIQEASVNSLPVNVTGPDGQLRVPAEAGNITIPQPPPEPLPEPYEEATAMRTKKRSASRKRQRSSSGRRKNRGRKYRRSTSRQGSGRRRRSSAKRPRRRDRITRR